MAQWSAPFETLMKSMDTETISLGPIYGLLHAWKNESGCLVWITEVPGGNIFGSTVVFVNDEVLQELQWSFEEWVDGTAPLAVFREEEAERIKLHLAAKSPLPVLAHVRKKNTPQNQEGNNYILHFHHDLPHSLRLTVGVPE